MKALFDTCILIDFMRGQQAARGEIERYSERLISIIGWMEVMVGVADAENQRTILGFLAEFECLNLTQDDARMAVEIRRQKKIKLPDAIIWAHAKRSKAMLITRNSRDFDQSGPGVRIPYII